ncbi:MAG: class A beta-lactamase-related serine hydrolase [Sphingobacteriaceae bacterium]|nr:class A beta-lactamase-related serine hydrolase [Sphingobacteriaceae bacterium]
MRNFFSVSIVLTFSLGCSVLYAQTVKTYDFSALNRKVQSWVDSGHYIGASILIAKSDKIIFKKHYGNFDESSVAYIASAGKLLAAATIASVVEKGKLSWDDKVSSWLPEFTDRKGEATLRQLLSHTSGYPDYQPQGKPTDNYQTLKEAVAHIAVLFADTLPGTRFNYGGLSMQVAGRMAELAEGKDWETIFHENIARRLEMKNTHFTPVDETPGHSPMLGGGARTDLQGYANFLSMILNSGVYKGKRVLSLKSLKEMQSDQVGTAEISRNEYVENARGTLRKGIYGLGEWREEVNEKGEAILISSPGWAGVYPWIDKKNKVYGFFLARVASTKNGFNSFYASPVLPLLVRDVISKSALPPTVKRGHIDIGDAKLYYEEAGKGIPVIFIHGHSFDHTEWEPQFFEFAKKYRTIRYDLRGYGQSSMPVEGKEFLHAEDLFQLMNKLGIKKAHLVGLSLGGFIVTDFLALHQDRILSATAASGDIFNVPGPDRPWTSEAIAKRRMEIQALHRKGVDVYKREWFNALTIRNGRVIEHIRKPVWEMIYKWDAWQPLHIEPRLLLGSSVIDKLKQQKITVPVMVLTGDADATHKNKLLELVPSAIQMFVKNAGHVSNLENPVEFNRKVFSFLSGM